MYKYIHTYIHTYIHAYMHTCMHIYIHTRIHTYTHTYIHTYMHTYIHTYIHIHSYIHAYIQVIKTLSTQFTNLESSWGWEQFLDLDKLYSIKSGYVQDVPGNDVANIQEGRISMEVGTR